MPDQNAIVPATPNLPAGPTAPFVERIRAEWRKSLEGILEAGRILIEAERELGKTRYLNMVQFQLPFSRATASKLRIIAGDKRIASCSFTNSLPPSWDSLYQLTHLKDEVFYQAITDGRIHAGITQKETKRLVNNPNAPSVRQQSRRQSEGEADGQKSAESAKSAKSTGSTGSTSPSTSPAVEITLTEGEFELIRNVMMLADKKGLVQEVAQRLWPNEDACFRMAPPHPFDLAEKLELDETLAGLSGVGDWNTMEGEIVS